MAFNKRESVVIGSSLDNIQLVWCKYLYYFFRLKGTHMQAQLCGKKLSLQFIQITSFAPAGLVIIGHCWWTIFPCITNWRRMGSTEPRHQPPNSQTCKKRKKIGYYSQHCLMSSCIILLGLEWSFVPPQTHGTKLNVPAGHHQFPSTALPYLFVAWWKKNRREDFVILSILHFP